MLYDILKINGVELYVVIGTRGSIVCIAVQSVAED